jgi:leucyl aminopeptidase
MVWTAPGFQTALILEDLPMSDAVKVGFVPFSAASRGILVVFCDDA